MYINYTNIFLFNLVIELPENIDTNKYVIKLIKGNQISYWFDYTLNLVGLEIFNSYIKTYLKTKLFNFLSLL